VEQAIAIVSETQRANASLLQRRLRIGYPRAARLIDELEELGIIGPSQGGGREREVLIGKEEESA
jgi:S-DNA-T family DNA segregation ATPase FtsK/SpoIIIE